MGAGDCINIFMATQPLSDCTLVLGIASVSLWLLSPVTLQMGTGDWINIFMATQLCHTANGYWGRDQYLHGYSALSHGKWVLGTASVSSWLLSPITRQMGTGDCINIFMATQPCHTANGYWGLHQYLCGYSALSHCKWVLGIASISLWLLSPVTLQMGTGDWINIFMATQPCHTANWYWGLHQYLHGYSALSHGKCVLGIASISLWLLSSVTLQMGTGEGMNIFMATQPSHYKWVLHWRLHQYHHGYSAQSHCKWVLEIASISLWLLSPVTLQMGTGDCVNIFIAALPCHTANGYWGLHQYLHGYPALSHCTWVLGIASVSLLLLSPVTLHMGSGDCVNIFMASQPCNTVNGYWGLHQYLYGYSALSHCTWVLGIASISLWLLSPVTLQMGTGDCINTDHGYSALSHCKWVLGIVSISLWLLSTLQMGTGDCKNILRLLGHSAKPQMWTKTGTLGSTKIKLLYMNENKLIKLGEGWRVYTAKGHNHTKNSTYREK